MRVGSQNGLVFNGKKCSFYGTVFTNVGTKYDPAKVHTEDMSPYKKITNH